MYGSSKKPRVRQIFLLAFEFYFITEISSNKLFFNFAFEYSTKVSNKILCYWSVSFIFSSVVVICVKMENH